MCMFMCIKWCLLFGEFVNLISCLTVGWNTREMDLL